MAETTKTDQSEQSEMPNISKQDPEEHLLNSTGFEDYAYWWKELLKEHEPAKDVPFRRGRIWA
jgi:cyanobactin cluster PatC/TenC/TruC protein